MPLVLTGKHENGNFFMHCAPMDVLSDGHRGCRRCADKKLFGADTRTRLRPSYFPFTEPSVEVDVSCFECHGKGCPLCKHTGWIEVLGGGVVNRKVLENCNIDPDEYSGFAFGIGIERIAMLKYGINNIGLMFENNLQFLKQFHE